MKIKTFIYAEDAMQDSSSGKARNVITNPLNFISIPFVPATFSFGIICGVVDTKGDKGQMVVKFEKEVPTEDSKKDTVTIGPIRIGDIPQDTSIPEHLQGFIFTVNVKNAILRDAGIYTTRIYLDDKEIDSFPIEVIEKTQ